MASAVVIDTNVLPMWRGLDGPLWLSVRKLCAVLDIVLYIPEIVIHESMNLRRDTYSKNSAEFLSSLREISRFFDAEPIYIPNADEICTSWEEELRGAFSVLPIRGDDAVTALEREALRQRPARNGRGARDSAIWMSALRLAETGQSVFFVSKNTRDFAVGKSGELHPQLALESGAMPGELKYLPSIYLLIENLATPIDAPIFNVMDVAEILRVEIRDLVYAQAILNEQFRDLSANDFSIELVALQEITPVRAYLISDKGLALLNGRGSVTVGDPDDQIFIGFDFNAWVDSDPSTGELLSGEVNSAQVHFESSLDSGNDGWT